VLSPTWDDDASHLRRGSGVVVVAHKLGEIFDRPRQLRDSHLQIMQDRD
jgi:hypothetical protein